LHRVSGATSTELPSIMAHSTVERYFSLGILLLVSLADIAADLSLVDVA
jgi:hypothetical protein